jgi:glutamine amidotransferase PdxT
LIQYYTGLLAKQGLDGGPQNFMGAKMAAAYRNQFAIGRARDSFRMACDLGAIRLYEQDDKKTPKAAPTTFIRA